MGRKKKHHYPKPTIHPGASALVKRTLRQVHRDTGTWNIRETARRLGINQGHVSKNLADGIEPKDEAIRLAMGLPRHPRQPREIKPPSLPKYVKWLKPEALPWYMGIKGKISQMSKDRSAEMKARKKG